MKTNVVNYAKQNLGKIFLGDWDYPDCIIGIEHAEQQIEQRASFPPLLRAGNC